MIDSEIEETIFNALLTKGINTSCVIYTMSATNDLFKPYLYLSFVSKDDLTKLQTKYLKSISDSSGIDYVSPTNDKVVRLRGNSLRLFLETLNS